MNWRKAWERAYLIPIIVFLLVDFIPRFFQGDSISYFVSQWNHWLPPDRSWIFGLLVNFVFRETRGFSAFMIAQIGVLVLVIEAFRATRIMPRPAWAVFAFLVALDPLLEVYTRFFMSDFLAMAGFMLGLCGLITALLGDRRGLVPMVIGIVIAILFRVAYAPICLLTVAGLVLLLRRRALAHWLVILVAIVMPFMTVAGLGVANRFAFAQQFPGEFFVTKLSGVYLAGVFAPALSISDFRHAGVMISDAEFKALDLGNYDKRLAQVWGTQPDDMQQFLRNELHVTQDYTQKIDKVSSAIVKHALLRAPQALAVVYLRTAGLYLEPQQWRQEVPEEMGQTRPLPDGFVAFINRISRHQIDTNITAKPSLLIWLYGAMVAAYPALLVLSWLAGLGLVLRRRRQLAEQVLFAALTADLLAVPLYSNFVIARYVLAALVISYALLVMAGLAVVAALRDLRRDGLPHAIRRTQLAATCHRAARIGNKLAVPALLCGSLLLGGLMSVHFGQDANWDLKNYHFYNAWSYQHGRLYTDLFAAGIQTYFAPLVEMPYYILSTGALNHHPSCLAFAMGLPFGLLIFLSLQIGWIAARRFDASPFVRALLALAATVFGLSGIAVISQVGTTTNEIQTAVLIIAGLWLILLHAERPRDWSRRSLALVVGAGLLFGLAAGLKLTAAVYAPGIGLCCLLLPGSLSRRLIRAVLFSAGWIGMVLLIWAPWGEALDHLTGNPLFPMFNNIFHSSWMPPTDARDFRYAPASLLQAIFYPFFWIDRNATVAEWPFADPRFATVYVGLMVLLLLGAVAWLRGRRPSPSAAPGMGRDYVAAVVLTYLIVSFAIWEAEFSILRYAAAVESLSGVALLVVVNMLLRMRSLPALVRRGAAACLAILMAGSIALSVYPHRDSIAFGQTVWDLRSPALKPGATVLLATQPIAFAAPFISQATPGVSFVGMPAYIDSDGFTKFKLGALVLDRIAQATSLYVAYYESDFPPIQLLADFGVKIDFSSCRPMTSNVSGWISLCEAERMPVPALRQSPLFSLEPVQIASNGMIDAAIKFSGGCSANPSNQIADIRYSTGKGLDGVQVYVQTPPLAKALLSESLGPAAFKTGAWATAGQTYLFTDMKGDVLASYFLKFVPCN